MKKATMFLIVIFIMFFAEQGICWDYYVDAVNGSEGNSGTASDNAWRTITHALIHVQGTEVDPAIIHVASGRYDITNGEAFPLGMKSHVSLKGADKESTIIDGSKGSSAIIAIKLVENVTIESLTITGGKGTEGTSGVIEGGGISFENSYDVVIEDCIIKGNSADLGGGICFMGSGYPDTYNEIKTFVTNCMISDNSASFGGGIFSEYRTDLTISYCTIKNNTSNSRGGGINCKSATISYCDITENKTTSPYGYCGGAGIYLENQFGVTIQNCKINSNSTASTGGGIGSMTGYGVSIIDSEIIGNLSQQSGGGVYLEAGGYLNEIAGCKIMNNSSLKTGGAIYFSTFYIEPMEAEPPDTIATLSITNTLISGNEASRGTIIFTSDQFDMTNCTIADNTSTTLGLKLVNSLDDLKAKNCIFWGNGSHEGIDGTADIKYSDVEGGYEGKGNINADPLFIQGPWGNYYLSQTAAGQDSDSPCIDSGVMIDALQFDPQWFTNRTDGIFDTNRADMGYHYPPHVQVNLDITPHKMIFAKGDNLRILLDLKTVPVNQNVDFYIIMKDPAGEIFSGMLWEAILIPAFRQMKLPGNLDLSDMVLLDIKIPSVAPAIRDAGIYDFYVAAVSTGTFDFLSNIATASFEVE